MDSVTIEELIRRYVQLPLQPNNGGWYPILCKVCNDHGRKGPRAAFKFDDGMAAYHCFNCGAKSAYGVDFDRVPKEMQEILDAFGVPEDEVATLRLTALQKRDGGSGEQVKVVQHKSINPKEIPLPDHFYRLSDATDDDKWAEIARYYLEDRNIEPSDYPFFLSTGVPGKYDGPPAAKAAFVKQAQKWKGRIIIPIYKDEKLIFYQGRDMTDRALKKYESPSVPKDRVLYGFDQLFTNDSAPLYVVEGFFDAFHINGVAILGNELSEAQIAWLNRSRRDKVYVPDKYGNGAKNAEVALSQGWKVSFPDMGDCKDISEGIGKYGRIFVHNTLREQTMEGFQAKATLNIYCKK